MLADVIGSNSTAALSFHDVAAAEEALAALKANHNVVGARIIFDVGGKPFASFQRRAG